MITGVGYNYRWAPLVQYAKQLIDDGELGEITNYTGRFFSMYGSDPLGLLSWRFLVDEAGYGVSTDILSHSVDLAHFLVGGDRQGRRHRRDVHHSSGRCRRAAARTTTAASPATRPARSPTRTTSAMIVRVRRTGRAGTFEACRSMVGPESQNAFEVYGTKGAVAWNFERMNELRVYIAARAQAHRLHHRVRRRPLPPPRRLRARAAPTASASRTWSASRTTSSCSPSPPAGSTTPASPRRCST